MRRYADELAATGRPLQEAELISFLLAGLDLDYNPLISALDARTEPITIDDLYSREAWASSPLQTLPSMVGHLHLEALESRGIRRSKVVAAATRRNKVAVGIPTTSTPRELALVPLEGQEV